MLPIGAGVDFLDAWLQVSGVWWHCGVPTDFIVKILQVWDGARVKMDLITTVLC
jgi:hypothetical protein